MGTPLSPKYIPYTYMDPLGEGFDSSKRANISQKQGGFHDLRV